MASLFTEKDYKQNIKDHKKEIKSCKEVIKRLKTLKKTLKSTPFSDLAKKQIKALKCCIQNYKERIIRDQNHLTELQSNQIKIILNETNHGKMKFKVIRGGLYESAHQ